jgi:hypothetical protein
MNEKRKTNERKFVDAFEGAITPHPGKPKVTPSN